MDSSPYSHVYDESLACFLKCWLLLSVVWLDMPELSRANDAKVSVMCATKRKIVAESLTVC
jgi:hypothetical protein